MLDNYLSSFLDIQEKTDEQSVSNNNKNKIDKTDTTVCDGIQFSIVCELFEKLSTIQNSSVRLKTLFNKMDEFGLKKYSVYPLLRLVLPSIDVHRLKDYKQKGNYNLKQKNMAKLYANALNLSKDHSEAYRILINWNDPMIYENVANGCDFGTILEDILKQRNLHPDYSNTTLKDINLLLDSLANSNQDEKLTIVKEKILHVFSPNEQKWIVRIIFNQLFIHLSYTQVLGEFYPKALSRYRECLDLKIICDEEGLSIDDINGIQLFTPYSPMLAKGYTQESSGQINMVEKTMSNENKCTSFMMEIKLDGERMSIHIDVTKNKVAMFTRQGNDYSSNYHVLGEDILDSFKKNPIFYDLKCILDGEVCVWDKLNNRRAPFGKNRTVAKIENTNESSTTDEFGLILIFSAFDIIYIESSYISTQMNSIFNECNYNNLVYKKAQITSLPLIVRKKILSKVITPIPNRLEIVPYRLVTNIEDKIYRIDQIESYFNEIVLAGEEGLVVKKLNSIYQLGTPSRNSGSWVKVKPDYGDQIDHLDLLILAAYYSTSSHSGGGGGGSNSGYSNHSGKGLSSFLCGVIDKNNPNLYYTVCKVSTGLSHSELNSIRQQFKDYSIIWNNNNIPNHFGYWKPKNSEQPNVYIPPEKSMVLELKFSELTYTENYSSGLTCRFPRVVRIRDDKAYNDIQTLDDIINIKDKPIHTTYEANEKNIKKQFIKNNQVIGNKRKNITADYQYHVANNDIKDHTSEIFLDKIFCIMGKEFEYKNEYNNSIDSITREQLIYAIQKNRGEVISVANKTKCQVIIDSKNSYNWTVQIKNLVQSKDKDVISVQYIIDCINHEQLLPLSRLYYFGLSQATKESFLGITDLFGDNYTEELNIEDARIILDRMDYIIEDLNHDLKSIKQSNISKVSSTSHSSNQLNNIKKNYKESQEINIMKDWNNIKDMDWKQIAINYLDNDIDQELLNFNLNKLWINHINIVYYFDFPNFSFGDEICSHNHCCCKSLDQLLLESQQQQQQLDNSNTERDYQYINEMKILYYRYLLYGANVTTHLHSKVTHIIQHSKNTHRNDLIQERIRNLRKINTYSCEKYIYDTIWAEKQLEKQILNDNELEINGLLDESSITNEYR